MMQAHALKINCDSFLKNDVFRLKCIACIALYKLKLIKLPETSYGI